MENEGLPPTPAAARAAVAAAEAGRASLAQHVELPPLFLASVGAAVALQIGTTAVGVTVPGPRATAALVAGFAVFLAVGAAQLLLFRRRNGVWLGGLLSRVVGGTASLASTSYAAALAGAIWAAAERTWWVTVVCALAGGVAYALSGRRWMRAYRSEPAAHGRGESGATVAVVGALALAGLALLAALR